MTLMKKYIDKSIAEKLVLDVYRTSFTSSPIFGTIIHQSDNFICIESIDEEGDFDGFSVVYKSHISDLGYGGKNRRERAERYFTRKPDADALRVDLTSIDTIIDSLISKFGYLSIYTEEPSTDQFYIGKVKEKDTEYLLLDAFGTEDDLEMSQILFNVASITRIDVDGKYERHLVKLYEEEA